MSKTTVTLEGDDLEQFKRAAREVVSNAVLDASSLREKAVDEAGKGS